MERSGGWASGAAAARDTRWLLPVACCLALPPSCCRSPRQAAETGISLQVTMCGARRSRVSKRVQQGQGGHARAPARAKPLTEQAGRQAALQQH